MGYTIVTTIQHEWSLLMTASASTATVVEESVSCVQVTERLTLNVLRSVPVIVFI